MPKPSKKTAAQPATSVDLEIVPRDEQQLTDAARQVRELRGVVSAKTVDLIYDVVALGVYLLKCRDVHCRQGRRTDLVETVSTSDDPDAGFLVFLEKEFCRGSAEFDTDEEHRRHVNATLRSFRNYMNAARNATLTGDHTLEDVQRLREKHFLDNLNLTDLYRLQDKEPEQQPPPQPKPSVHATYSADLSKLCSEILTLKDDCPSEFYEANHTLLKSTLEAYTGAEWVIAGTANHGEHAQVHIAGKTAKRAKAKKKKR
jgi:hypothetical protein